MPPRKAEKQTLAQAVAKALAKGVRTENGCLLHPGYRQCKICRTEVQRRRNGARYAA